MKFFSKLVLCICFAFAIVFCNGADNINKDTLYENQEDVLGSIQAVSMIYSNSFLIPSLPMVPSSVIIKLLFQDFDGKLCRYTTNIKLQSYALLFRSNFSKSTLFRSIDYYVYTLRRIII